eukprot:COSAG01_NODE_2048_length_8556_cov_27.174509_8_plen_98_part_00
MQQRKRSVTKLQQVRHVARARTLLRCNVFTVYIWRAAKCMNKKSSSLTVRLSGSRSLWRRASESRIPTHAEHGSCIVRASQCAAMCSLDVHGAQYRA